MLGLVFESGRRRGKALKLPEKGRVRVGSAATCQLRIEEGNVPAICCVIERTSVGHVLLDKTGQGTLVNDAKVDRRVLVGNDRIRIGEVTLRVVQKDTDPLVGKELRGHRIEAVLGRDRMGVLYRATQVSLNRPVVLKVLSRELAKDAEAVEQFIAEARAAGQWNHANLVQVLDVAEEDGHVFYSLEYLPGGRLNDLLQQGKRLPWRNVVRYMKDAVRALLYAESNGMTHLDLRPDNLLLTQQGRVKVADLGIATDFKSRVSEGQKIPADYVRYLAPEQFVGGELDHRTDIYSLGCTFYHAFSGRVPCPGATAKEVAGAKILKDPPPLAEVAPSVPDPIAELIERMMARDPEARCGSFGDVLEVLEESEAPIEAAPANKSAKRLVKSKNGVRRKAATPDVSESRSPKVALIAGGAVLLIAILAVVLWPPSKKPPSGGDGNPPVAGKSVGEEPPKVAHEAAELDRPELKKTQAPKRKEKTVAVAKRGPVRGGAGSPAKKSGTSAVENPGLKDFCDQVRRLIDQQVKPKIDADEFAAAMKTLEDYRMKFSQCAKPVDEEIARVERLVKAAVTEAEEAYRAHMEAGEFSDATDVVNNLILNLPATYKEWADERVKKATTAAAAANAFEKRFAEARKEVVDRIAVLDFRAAKKTLASVPKSPLPQHVADRRDIAFELNACDTAWSKLTKALEAAKGTAYRDLGFCGAASDGVTADETVSCRVTGIDLAKRTLEIQPKGASKASSRKIFSLSDESLIELMSVPKPVDGVTREGLGMLLLSQNGPRRARGFFSRLTIDDDKQSRYQALVTKRGAEQAERQKGEIETALTFLLTDKGASGDGAAGSTRKDSAWGDLAATIRAAIEMHRGFPYYVRVRSDLANHYLVAYKHSVSNQGIEGLIHGKAKLKGQDVTIRYNFSKEDEAKDFLPVSGLKNTISLDAKRKTLRLRGEFRLLQGNPFRNRLKVTGTVVKYSPGSPNINLAFWTHPKDRVTYKGYSRTTTSTGSSTRRSSDEEYPTDYFAFGMGYKPVSRSGYSYYDYLRVVDSDRVCGFPGFVILGGAHGSTVHDTYRRWECIWGEGSLNKIKGPQKFIIELKPKGFRWDINRVRLRYKRSPNLFMLQKEGAVGSISLFTCGDSVVWSSLTVEGELNPDWLLEAGEKQALAELKKFEPDYPFTSRKSRRRGLPASLEAELKKAVEEAVKPPNGGGSKGGGTPGR